jgi:dTDP-glucose pyrophosphorylase
VAWNRGRGHLSTTTKAVVLARGLGTRMRRADSTANLDRTQSHAADAGVKGMIPIGRPFLEYVISSLADAGIAQVCLVIGPEHETIRRHFERDVRCTRVRIHFAVQREPRGTADAVLAAESFAEGEYVLVINSDNLYPVHTLTALRELGAAGVAAFEREALVRLSNIDSERVARFSVVETDGTGMLRRIVEKPDPAVVAAMRGEVFVGMNSWSLPPQIYEACRSISPSLRGELELPDAVQFARDTLGVAFRVLRFHDGVLDLSSRSDIAAVAARLRGLTPRL